MLLDSISIVTDNATATARAGLGAIMVIDLRRRCHFQRGKFKFQARSAKIKTNEGARFQLNTGAILPVSRPDTTSILSSWAVGGWVLQYRRTARRLREQPEPLLV